MEYMLIFAESAEALARRDNPAEAGAYWGAWGAYVEAARGAGVMTGGAGLQPPTTATTVRVREGQRVVQDGPFAESKEILGGFFLIDVPDLDEALAWAARSPAAQDGAVEVRPVLPPME